MAIIFETYNVNNTIKVQFANEQDAIDYAVANNFQVRSIEMPSIVIESRPNWQGFLNAMDVPPIGNGLFALGLLTPEYKNEFWHLYQMILRLIDMNALADNSVPEWRTFNFLYAQAVGVYSPEQRQLVEYLLAANNIPIPSL